MATMMDSGAIVRSLIAGQVSFGLTATVSMGRGGPGVLSSEAAYSGRRRVTAVYASFVPAKQDEGELEGRVRETLAPSARGIRSEFSRSVKESGMAGPPSECAGNRIYGVESSSANILDESH
jgi:hypothetical protein